MLYILYTQNAQNTRKRGDRTILEVIFKGFLEWFYSLVLEIVEYIANELLFVFSMDLHYFETNVPVISDIVNIVIASGWALLLGNLVFQAAKSMMSGLGFEGEDPSSLFARTFVFGFMLLASRQICDIGLGISNTVITLLQVPPSISVDIPADTAFAISSAWLLVMIIGLVVMWQLVKLFFEIGERYFLVCFLTIMSPWAFAMGGSKNTADIFKGWARMFASMCLMMVMNVIFLKILLSVMGNLPSGADVLPWLIFVVAIARVAKKIDSVIARIGLNPALTGDGLGRGFPGMLSMMVIRSLASGVAKSAGGTAGTPKTPTGGSPNPSGHSTAGNRGGAFGRSNGGHRGTAGSQSGTQHQNLSSPAQPAETGAAGTQLSGSSALAQTVTPGTAGTPPTGANPPVPAESQAGRQLPTSSVTPATSDAAGTAAYTAKNAASSNVPTPSGQGDNRRSSISKPNSVRSPIFRTGAAGKQSQSGQSAAAMHPPIPRYGQSEQTAPGSTQTASQGESQAHRPFRYSAVPPNSSAQSRSSGAAGTVNSAGSSQTQQGGTSVNAQNQTNVSMDQSASRNEFTGASNNSSSYGQKQGAPSGARNAAKPATPGIAGMGNTPANTNIARGAAGSGTQTASAISSGAAGTEAHRSNGPSSIVPGRSPADTPRSGGNRPPSASGTQTTGERSGTARTEGSSRRTTGEQKTARQPMSGAAGKGAQSAKPSNPVLNQVHSRGKQSVMGRADKRKTKGIKKYRKGGDKQ